MNVVQKREREQAATRPFYHRFAWAYDLIIRPPDERRIAAVAEAFAREGWIRALRS